MEDSMQLPLGIAMHDKGSQWFSLNKFTLDTAHENSKRLHQSF